MRVGHFLVNEPPRYVGHLRSCFYRRMGIYVTSTQSLALQGIHLDYIFLWNEFITIPI